MQTYGDNFIPVIPVDASSIKHSVKYPYCLDPDCPCWKQNQPRQDHCEPLSENERDYVLMEGLRRIMRASRGKPKGYYSFSAHSVELPFCKFPTCPCHEDPDLIAVMYAAYLAGEVTAEECTNIVTGKTF